MLDRRLLFVSGKGGVGKSAVAAALAILAARRGMRVLALAMRDPDGLAGHLGAESLAYRPHEVRPGVHALAVERMAALDEYFRIQTHAPKIAGTQTLMRSLESLVDAAPGIREVVTVGKPIYELWTGDWDVIVADAPPVGQIGSYLRAPATVAGLVPAGRIQDQAAAMRRALADPGTVGLVLVTTPEELPTIETMETLDDLAADPVVDVAGLVLNRVLDPLDLTTGPADLPPGPHGDAARLHDGLVRQQRAWRERLPDAPPLPFLFGMHTPTEVAARLADALESI